MRFRLPSLILAILVVLAVAGVTTIRQEMVLVPRVRVGPLASDEPAKPVMRFFAVGDTGSGNEAQEAVAKAMEERCKLDGGVDAILLLGDNAYPAGFSSVEDPQWQTKVMDPYGSPCLGKLPIYAVLGNHDYFGNPAAEIEYTLINSRWHMPNRFYSVRFGDLVKFVAIDTNITDFCFKPAFCSIDFLLSSLREHDSAWTVALAHHPLESSSDHGFNYRGGLRGKLLKPYLCDRLDVWLSGHSHHLEALQEDNCRLEMFVVGGGGGDLYKTVPPGPDTKFVVTAHGFMELEVSQAELTGRFIGTDGKVLFSTSKRHPAGA
jgi:tartrate-resistant acid phosphatase type 5